MTSDKVLPVIEPHEPHIGTLNERSLHAALKDWYAESGDRCEVPIDGFVADIVRGDLIIEIQTGSMTKMRRKLASLLRRHPVRLVLPLPAIKTIVWIDAEGQESSRRRSPRRRSWIDAFDQLVSLRHLLSDSNLSVDILLVHEEEVRGPLRKRRRRVDWSVHDRRLVEVRDAATFADPTDYLAFVPPSLDEPFTTSQLSRAVGCSMRTAQKAAYTLRHIGTLLVEGKAGRSVLYRRTLAGAEIHEGKPERCPDPSDTMDR